MELSKLRESRVHFRNLVVKGLMHKFVFVWIYSCSKKYFHKFDDILNGMLIFLITLWVNNLNILKSVDWFILVTKLIKQQIYIFLIFGEIWYFMWIVSIGIRRKIRFDISCESQ